MKAARENLGFGIEDMEPSTMTLLLGAECSQLLSLEKVTWLWIPPPCAFPSGCPPPNHHYPFSLTRPSHSLLSEVIFSTIPFPLHPSVWPSRESLILSTLQICTLFRHGMPTPLQCLTLAPPPLLPTQTLMFIRRYSAHQLHPTLSGLFRSDRTGVAYDSHTTE